MSTVRRSVEGTWVTLKTMTMTLSIIGARRLAHQGAVSMRHPHLQPSRVDQSLVAAVQARLRALEVPWISALPVARVVHLQPPLATKSSQRMSVMLPSINLGWRNSGTKEHSWWRRRRRRRVGRRASAPPSKRLNRPISRRRLFGTMIRHRSWQRRSCSRIRTLWLGWSMIRLSCRRIRGSLRLSCPFCQRLVSTTMMLSSAWTSSCLECEKLSRSSRTYTRHLIKRRSTRSSGFAWPGSYSALRSVRMQLSTHWSDPSHTTPLTSITIFQQSSRKAGVKAHQVEPVAQAPRSSTSLQRGMEVC